MALATGRALCGESPAKDAWATPFKYDKLVLRASSDPTAFDSRSVDCPFVFEHNGRFYMTYVGWDGTGYQTGLASSSDLVRWQKLGCIIRRDPESPVTRYNVAMTWIVRENQLRSPARLKKVNGRYLGTYHAYPSAGYETGPAVIGLCWSDDLLKWDLESPVLYPKDGAEWERGGLYKACIVSEAGRFYLFYNAKNVETGNWREQTGVAVSSDLKTWKRFEGNPIVRNGGPGSPDEKFASDPCVVKDKNEWLVFYFGLDAAGKARDLLARGGSPFQLAKVDDIIVDVGAHGSVDETYAHKPSVIWHDGALYHFYCAVAGRFPNETRGISVARSRRWS